MTTQLSVNLNSGDPDTTLSATCTPLGDGLSAARTFRVALCDSNSKSKAPLRVFGLFVSRDKSDNNITPVVGGCDVSTLQPADWHWIADALCGLFYGDSK